MVSKPRNRRFSPRTLSAPGYHPIYARVLCAAAEAHGIAAAQLLARAGLGEADIGVQAVRVSHDQMNALIAAARSLWPDPRLALEWGARVGNNVHGIAGAAFLSSRDVRQAMTILCAVAALRSTTVQVSVAESDDISWLQIVEVLPMNDEREFLLAGLATVLVQLLSVMLGPASTRLLIELPLQAVPWAAACAGIFPSAPRFEAPNLRFGVPIELLDQLCPTADAEAHAAAMRQCALDTLNLSGKLAARIAAYLAQQTGTYPTLAAVAKDFCMSERSVSRSLRDEGTTYQTLLDVARLDAAQRYLRQTNLAVDQIAERVGYADTSNFIRAFRRWCGRTPRQYRGEVGSPVAG